MTLSSYNQALATAALVVLGFALWTIIDRLDRLGRPEPGKAAALQPANEVQGSPKVAIEPPKVIYVHPGKSKAALGLPAKVQKDDTKQVIATGKLVATDRPYTMSAVLDTETGQSQLFARPDPLPWIAPGSQGAIGMAYGTKRGEPTGRLYGRYDLVQIKALYAGAGATLDQDGDWFAGGYMEWRF